MREYEQQDPFNRTDWIAVAILFVTAAGLRLYGNRYGLPWIWEPDADSVVLAKALCTGETGYDHLLKPSRYPHLIVYFLLPLLKIFPETSDIWLGRILSGLFGAGTVVMTYLCGRLAAGRRAGLLAGLLVCFSILSVQHSHMVKPHIAVGFFATACVYACMRILQRPSTGNYILAGLMGAGAVAVLHSGFVVGAGLLASVMLAPSPHGLFSWRRYLSRGPLAALGLICLAIPLGYPNRLMALYEILQGHQEWEYIMRPHVPHTSDSIGFSGYVRIPLVLLQYDPWVGIAGSIALMWGFFKPPHWWKLCIPGMCMTLFFFAVFGHVRSFMPRFCLLVLPTISVIGAVWMVVVLNRLMPSFSRWSFPLVALLLLLPGAPTVLRLDWLYTQEDTRIQAVRWIERNVPEDVPLAAVPFLDFPL
ncbi:MAG: glycosyltransferase family 39 protein, partial [Planctomycetes bacterium]|nr:glycosyltransferase family 39 protein [Planctomycetota bacterium]